MGRGVAGRHCPAELLVALRTQGWGGGQCPLLCSGLQSLHPTNSGLGAEGRGWLSFSLESRLLPPKPWTWLASWRLTPAGVSAGGEGVGKAGLSKTGRPQQPWGCNCSWQRFTHLFSSHVCVPYSLWLPRAAGPEGQRSAPRTAAPAPAGPSGSCRGARGLCGMTRGCVSHSPEGLLGPMGHGGHKGRDTDGHW